MVLRIPFTVNRQVPNNVMYCELFISNFGRHYPTSFCTLESQYLYLKNNFGSYIYLIPGRKVRVIFYRFIFIFITKISQIWRG